jgi:hypothetical protein
MMPAGKYNWVKKNNHVTCAKGAGGQSIDPHLWEADELTDFHDADLMQATKEINAILTKIVNNNKDSTRKLSYIQFQNRHLLVLASLLCPPSTTTKRLSTPSNSRDNNWISWVFSALLWKCAIRSIRSGRSRRLPSCGSILPPSNRKGRSPTAPPRCADATGY